MLDFSQAKISHLAIHYSGNKLKDEGFKLTGRDCQEDLSDEDTVLLKRFLLRPFTTEEFYAFYHSYDINQNEVYGQAGKIFADPSSLVENSKNICRHLYGCSEHPKIKGGEVFVALFTDCIIYSQTVSVLGIFKCENKDKFITTDFNKNGLSKINFLEGTHTKHLDKGCLIYNISGEDGYAVLMTDSSANKGEEARFWKDEFLSLVPRQDNYFNTANYLKMCKEFVVTELPKQHPVDKTHQIDILNRSVDYFKNNETFQDFSFTEEIFEKPEIINSFNQYKQEYQKENNFELGETFEISNQAVKKQSKVFKSVLKLDKNFHVYIHGDRNLIERGFDENTGKKFYKIYFDEEA